METSELTGAALDWAVAKCEGFEPFTDTVSWLIERDGEYVGLPNYSTNWSHGGLIIEREKIDVAYVGKLVWSAIGYDAGEGSIGLDFQYGETPLIAAMRCYVVAKLGDEIDVPKELL